LARYRLAAARLRVSRSGFSGESASGEPEEAVAGAQDGHDKDDDDAVVRVGGEG